MFWKKKNKSAEELMQQAYKIQEEKYENIDFIVAAKKDKKETIKHFIESEDDALNHKMQGLIFPEFHYELKDISESRMSGFNEEEIEHTFYHLLRLGSLFKPHENNFHLYKKAFKRIAEVLEAEEYHVCHLNRYSAYLVFGVINTSDKEKIAQISYEEFIALRKFVLKSGSYSHYPGMRKKKAQFSPFLTNELLMQRARESIQMFQTYSHKMSIGGVLMLLLLDENESSKEVLLKLHSKNQSNSFVWVLGSFYKDFQDSSENKKLLSHLYENYPIEWIDKYQRENM